MLRVPGQRAILPVSLAVVLVASLLAVPEPAAAKRPSFQPRATQQEKSVPGKPVRLAEPRPPSQSSQRKWRPPAPVRWPSAGSAEVDLTASAAPQRAGDLPVRVARPANAGPTATPGSAAPRTAAPAGGGAPTRLRVTVAGRPTTEAAGVSGLLMSVQRADGDRRAGRAAVTVDYSGFRGAYGGDWASRLRLVQLPTCALTEPDLDACRVQRPLPTRNDMAAGTLTSEVDAGDAATVLAAIADPAGASGSFKATSLSPSGAWKAGGNSGSFIWSYDIDTPPVPGEFEPDVGLNYSSASVDGHTAPSNNQPGWIGEGWEYDPGYIERAYAGCTDDMGSGANNTAKTGDLCWKTDNAVISLNGESTTLVRDDSTGTWRLAEDDGSRVEHLTGTATDTNNGDNDNEYWKITKSDGTQYWFGKNRLPGWTSGKTETASTFAAPVFGNHSGEPCHQTSYASSYCNQAWRWQLDYAVDPSGNAMAFFYTKETNAYSKNMATTATVNYTRAGYLDHIEYGHRAGQVYAATAPAKVVFGVSERCLTNCGTFDTAHAANWPDAPADQQCTLNASCLNASPSFWSRKRLTSITTSALVGSAYSEVDSWTLTHDFPGTGDNTTAALWLSSISRTGKSGTAIALPQVDFGGTAYDNRVDAAEGRPPMHKYRLTRISNETGGDVLVSYSEPECAYTALPIQDANNKRCYPMWWTPDGYLDPLQDWFHRYVVSQVVEDDKVSGAGSESTVTSYEYSDGVAWHRDDSEFTLAKHRGWNQFRGYGRVLVRTGTTNQTLTETRYFRGMDGDLLASGSPRSVSVADSEGTSITDADALAGTPREEITYTSDGGTVDSAEVTEPWLSAPTATHAVTGLPAQVARRTDVAATYGRELISTSSGTAWRRTTTRTTFNSDGLPATEEDLGDTAVTGDETCERITYTARDATNWQLDYEATELTTSAPCAVAASPSNTLTEQRHYYDSQALGVTPQAGKAHETRTETLDRFSGSTPVYVSTTTAYDAYDRPTSHTDEVQVTTTRSYTPATGAQPTSMTTTDGKGRPTVSTLDTRGNTRTSTDPNGRITYTDFDALGRLTAVWEPGRAKTQPADELYTYAVSRTAPTAITTKTLLDNGSYRTAIRLQDGFLRERQTQLAASSGGRLVHDTFYDSHGREWKTNDDYWNSTAPSTTLLAVLDTDVPAQTVTLFDGRGRDKASILMSSGVEKWRTTITYGGNWRAVVPPAGKPATLEVIDAGEQVTQLRQYHAGSSPVFTASASSYDATSYTRDVLDRLRKVVDPAGNTWTFTPDLRGREISSADPDAGPTTTAYDAAGRVTSTTDARGVTVAYTYDELGRKTSTRKGSATGTKLAEWTYDTVPGGLGLLASSIRYLNGQAYTSTISGYDNAGRATGTTVTIPSVSGEEELAGTYQFGTTYTTTGLVETTSYPAMAGLPAETVNHGYTAFGMPNTLDNGSQLYLSGAKYNAHDEVAQATLGSPGNRVTHTLTYSDATRRLDTVTNDRERTGPQTLDSTTYTYDPAGNVTRIKQDRNDATSVDDQCFRYDYLRRLTEAWTATDGCAGTPSASTVGGPAAYWQTFTYDVMGNRKIEVRHDPGGNTSQNVTRTYGYPAAGQARPHTMDQITSTGPGARTDTFEYDATGNTKRRVTAAGDQTLEWDDEGRLAKSTIGGAVTEFAYDSEGERLLRRDPTTTTLYLNGQELSVTRSTGVMSGIRYYEGPDCTVVRSSTGTVSYLLADHHGTDQLSVDATTLAPTRRDTAPFGGARGVVPAAWPDQKGFVGGTIDDTSGLIELGARQYDPETGRFISVDPILDPLDPQQVNAYAYSNNSPVTMSDPDGQRIADRDIAGYCYYHNNCKSKKAKRYVRKRSRAENASFRRYWKAVKKHKAKPKPKPKPKPKKKTPAWLSQGKMWAEILGYLEIGVKAIRDTRTWAYRTMRRGATPEIRSRAAKIVQFFRRHDKINKLAWAGKSKWFGRAGPPLIALGGIGTYIEERHGGASHVKAGSVAAGGVAGGVAGAWAGAQTGAAIGTVVGGPVGTLAGGLIGGAVGGIVGGKVGEKLVDKAFSWF